VYSMSKLRRHPTAAQKKATRRRWGWLADFIAHRHPNAGDDAVTDDAVGRRLSEQEAHDRAQ
jgi:hypothetical protein